MLELIPKNKWAEFLKVSYLHGLSEICAVWLEKKILQTSKHAIFQYTSHYYVYQRLDLLYPMPKLHDELIEFFSRVTLPLSEEALTELTSFGSEENFRLFLKESQLEEYYT